LRRFEYGTWIGFVVLGMGIAVLSAALPYLRHWLGAGYATLSWLFVSSAAGNTVGYFGANRLVDRLGSARLLPVAVAVFGGGYVVMALTHWLWLWLPVTACIGFGGAVIDVGSSRAITDLYQPKPARALNLLNVFFGLGAILGPLVTAVALNHALGVEPVFGFITLLSVAGLVMLGRPVSLPAPGAGDEGEAGFHAWRTSWVVRIGLATFLYIAAEIGFGSWISPFAHREAAVSAASAALFPMVFWGGLMVTRIVASLPQNRLPLSPILVTGALLGAAMSAFAMAVGHAAVLLMVAAFLVGASFGPSFPGFLALASQRAPNRVGAVYHVIYATMAVAALVVPWAEGQIFVHAPYVALGITPAVCLLMAGLLWYDGRRWSATAGHPPWEDEPAL
jgi:fucose permease